MQVAIFYDPQNTFLGSLKRFKKDGDEFERQAMKCAKWYSSKGCEVVTTPIVGKNAYEKRQDLFYNLRVLNRRRKPFDRVIFFCHGHAHSLNRKMVTYANIGKFSRLIQKIGTADCKVIFYSCKTAKKDDGFAVSVSINSGFEVVGHSTSGHTTRNPHKWLVRNLQRTPLFRSCDVRKIKKEFSENAENAFIFVEENLK